MSSYAEQALAGSKLAGSRLIRQLEEGNSQGVLGMKAIYAHAGRAFIVGITGPPGVGKSTLVDQMVVVLRVRGHRVGVLAVDPSSPFTGGAVLGDRIRMQRHALDEGVFVRSMATRGQLGGLARTTREAALVLDAMGFDVILIETVGVGQDELDVAELAHTTVVASPPGMGDDIQAIKSGILEIGDVFVVNKADHPGTGEAVAQLRGMLGMRPYREGDWLPPVLRTVASAGEGIAELVDTCFAHRHHLTDSGRFAGHMFRWELHVFKELVKQMTFDKLFGTHNENSREFELLIQKLKARKIDPYSAAESLVQRV